MINKTLVGLVLVVMVMVTRMGAGNGELFVVRRKIGASFLRSILKQPLTSDASIVFKWRKVWNNEQHLTIRVRPSKGSDNTNMLCK